MAAANAVLRLVNALGTDNSETGELIKVVSLNEQSGDHGCRHPAELGADHSRQRLDGRRVLVARQPVPVG